MELPDGRFVSLTLTQSPASAAAAAAAARSTAGCALRSIASCTARAVSFVFCWWLNSSSSKWVKNVISLVF